MEPYDNGKVLAFWKEESSTSSESSDEEDRDDEEDEDTKKQKQKQKQKQQPKGYYKIKIPIKKIFSTILVEEELIPE